MLRIFVTTFLAIVVVAASAAAQTTTSTTTTPSTTTTSNEGVFDRLSPGNQKIAMALFEAQKTSGISDVTSSPPPTTSKTLSLDDIAAMKQGGKGWGVIFKEMRAQGLIQEKNLGQVVSHANHQVRFRGAIAGTGDPVELRIQGAQARDLDAQAINDTLAKPGDGVAKVKIRDVTMDPALIDITNISPGLREVKIEGRTPAGTPFEIKREQGEIKLEGVNLRSEQIQAILNRPGVRQVKIEGVTVDPNQLDLQNLPAGLREAKIEGTTPAGTPFEVKVKDGVVRREVGGEGRHGGKGHHGTLITTGSGRSHMVGVTAKPEHGSANGRRHDDNHRDKSGGDDHPGFTRGDHGRKHSDSGRQGSFSKSGRDFRGSDKSLSSGGSGSSGKSGHRGRGKD